MKAMVLSSVAALLFTVASGRAATITQSQTTGLLNVEFNTSLYFNRFDSTMGTLNSIQVTVTQALVHTGVWINDSPTNAKQTFTFNSDSVLEVSVPGPAGVITTSAHLSTGPISSTTPGDAEGFSNGISLPNGPNTYSDSTTLSLFTGPGNIGFSLGTTTSTFTISGSSFISLTTSNPLLESATVELDYNYTPAAPVPEPGTVGLGLMGVGGMLVRRRR